VGVGQRGELMNILLKSHCKDGMVRLALCNVAAEAKKKGVFKGIVRYLKNNRPSGKS
jgi:hypothetical protein